MQLFENTISHPESSQTYCMWFLVNVYPTEKPYFIVAKGQTYTGENTVIDLVIYFNNTNKCDSFVHLGVPQ